jgi:beta-phosphoglucomutase-like phosphatase (HAD superfamily)
MCQIAITEYRLGGRMFELCLFDLDNTLVRTDDLDGLRQGCANNSDSALLQELLTRLRAAPNRAIYSMAILQQIRARFPLLKVGVFTRSPRSYAQTVLGWAFPDFVWDVIIGYEDVNLYKPNGEGIQRAMAATGVALIDKVLMVGESPSDVRAAYNAGCVAVLDKSSWPNPPLQDHWRALDWIPDAVIHTPTRILEVLEDYAKFLPELERLLAGGGAANNDRYCKINHFIPALAGGDNTAYQINACGRSFANYPSLQVRRGWHGLTASIENNKDSHVFPTEWIEAIRTFIKDTYLLQARNLVVTVVPHRPTRPARLESMLAQLGQTMLARPIVSLNVRCVPGILAYRPEVRSQHGEHLGQIDRFTNVQQNMYLMNPATVEPNTSYLVIDDVVTTGASLIYAKRLLQAQGSTDVKCLAMAKNISNVL